jgi:hypothetical protein
MPKLIDLNEYKSHRLHKSLMEELAIDYDHMIASCAPMLAYVNDVVCGGDERAAKWLLAYLAHSIQHGKVPSIKTMPAPAGFVILGGEHDNIRDFIELIAGNLYMPGRTVTVESPRDLIEQVVSEKPLLIYNSIKGGAVVLGQVKQAIGGHTANLIVLMPDEATFYGRDRHFTIAKAVASPPAFEADMDQVNAFCVLMTNPALVSAVNLREVI